MPDPIVQPQGITDRFKLYPYQLDAVSFMKEIENTASKGISSRRKNSGSVQS